jgi:alkylhydroperoxidase/carboxymuconolactone decarboxylase family protein YurZ
MATTDSVSNYDRATRRNPTLPAKRRAMIALAAFAGQQTNNE